MALDKPQMRLSLKLSGGIFYQIHIYIDIYSLYKGEWTTYVDLNPLLTNIYIYMEFTFLMMKNRTVTITLRSR